MNFEEEVEAGINKQINMELYASYVYMSMAYYFERPDVALAGFYAFFKKQSDDEREHAQKFMKYQNMRGGRIVLQTIGVTFEFCLNRLSMTGELEPMPWKLLSNWRRL